MKNKEQIAGLIVCIYTPRLAQINFDISDFPRMSNHHDFGLNPAFKYCCYSQNFVVYLAALKIKLYSNYE